MKLRKLLYEAQNYFMRYIIKICHWVHFYGTIRDEISFFSYQQRLPMKRTASEVNRIGSEQPWYERFEVLKLNQNNAGLHSVFC